MGALLPIAGGIDRVNTFIGKWISWLIFVAVFVSAGNAVIRKSFNISSNAWLELQWYLFGAVFMLAASWTLKADEHVRVDVLSSMLSQRARARIDLICHVLFLMPFVLVMTYLAWPFFVSSYMSGEQSSNAGGLVRWPAKLWVLIGFAMLIVQGVSEIIKRAAMLTGDLPFPDDVDEEEAIRREAAERRG